jgi:protein pelota
MKILTSNFKKGLAKIKVETLDDLWYLSNIIDENDFVKGQTTRKIRIGEKEERAVKIVKKTIFLKIQVQKIEFHKYTNILRVGGTIVEGPDDVQKGSHHTFNIEEGTILTIEKPEWLQYQIQKIKESAEQKIPNALIVVLDREEAYFALLKKYGYELLTHLKGQVSKKAVETIKTEDFYSAITKAINEYIKRYKIENVIVASPAFWKEELMKTVKDESLKKKIVLATCSSCDEKAFNEIIRRPEVEFVLKHERIAKETKLVEDLLQEISKEGPAAYGTKDVKTAVEAGAVKILLVSDKFILESRQANKYEEIEYAMKMTDKIKGQVHIISSDHDAGKKLDGLGGVAAILRYKLV